MEHENPTGNPEGVPSLDVGRLALAELLQLRNDVEQALHSRGHISDEASARSQLEADHILVVATGAESKRAGREIRSVVVLMIGAAYVVLVTAGLLYGVWLGGEPPMEVPAHFNGLAVALAAAAALSALATWLLPRSCSHASTQRSTPRVDSSAEERSIAIGKAVAEGKPIWVLLEVPASRVFVADDRPS